ncbi:lmo0954 family membrane protein [Peribacillus tepidiphilus]|uniref:lmo0954 family membrane protein n=1 Tax=Peribacillus tepidiphilus TaxID=2652445 RepID=UPI0035B536B2
MKKFGLLLLGGIAAIAFLANLGPMVALAISLVITYFVIREFLKAETTMKKIMWGIIGFIALTATLSNIPSVIGIAAAYVLYLVYKKWNEPKEIVSKDHDPFRNFEKQWAEMNKY